MLYTTLKGPDNSKRALCIGFYYTAPAKTEPVLLKAVDVIKTSQNLIPVETLGALKSLANGFVLMLFSVLSLYYGNLLIVTYAEHLQYHNYSHNFSHMLFGAGASIFIRGVQVLSLLLAWILIGKGISHYLGRFELAIRLLVSSVGIWMTWVVFPVLSDLLVYSFPLDIFMLLLLVLLFEFLTQQVDNQLDKGAAMMLWIYSLQSLELLPTFLADGESDVVFNGMFRTSEEIAMANMAAMALSMSFMAGAVISTWVLASYSIKLSQVRSSWVNLGEKARRKEDDMQRTISMIEMNNLVHDLRSPLAAIKGMALMLRNESKGRAGAMEKATIMLNATNYMERMVTEILHEEKLNEVQIEAFFDDFERHVRPFPWGEEVIISVDQDAGQELAELNEIRFTRALLNVMDNAWRANRTAGAKGIELNVRLKSSYVEVEILDNGPGVKQEPAYQKSGWGSTGLGLAFARKIATAHKGRLLLSQRFDAPNGASVIILLPTIKRTANQPRGTERLSARHKPNNQQQFS